MRSQCTFKCERDQYRECVTGIHVLFCLVVVSLKLTSSRALFARFCPWAHVSYNYNCGPKLSMLIFCSQIAQQLWKRHNWWASFMRHGKPVSTPRFNEYARTLGLTCSEWHKTIPQLITEMGVYCSPYAVKEPGAWRHLKLCVIDCVSGRLLRWATPAARSLQTAKPEELQSANGRQWSTEKLSILPN